MHGCECPKCGHNFKIYNDDKENDNTDKMCEDFGLKKLASMPMNPLIAYLIDKGENPFEESIIKEEMLKPYVELCEKITKGE